MHVSQTASQANYIPATKAAHRPGRLELGILFIVLILFTEGVLPRLVASDQSAEGSPLLRLVWLPVYGLALLGMVWKAKDVLNTMVRMPFMLVLMGLALVSFFWSIDSSLSGRRGFAIAMTCLAGIFMGTRYSWQTLLRMLGLTWIVVAVLSFLTAIGNPGFGVMSEIHPGAWKGLYYEKNQLGGHMARAAFLCAFLAFMDPKWRRRWLFGAAICTFLVLMTTSKTSLLGLLLGFGVLGVGAWMKRGRITGLGTLWIGATVVGVVAALFVFAPEFVFGLLGRDPSLTGRTDIWAALMQRIAERPVLGYGYGAFWAVDSEPAYWVREVLEWDAPTAHNGWLEVAIALGLFGLVCLVFDFLMTVGRAVISSIDTWTGLFALGVCAQFLLFSLSESISLQQNSITWVTYIAVAAKLANRPRHLLPKRPVWVSRPLRRLQADGA